MKRQLPSLVEKIAMGWCSFSIGVFTAATRVTVTSHFTDDKTKLLEVSMQS